MRSDYLCKIVGLWVCLAAIQHVIFIIDLLFVLKIYNEWQNIELVTYILTESLCYLAKYEKSDMGRPSVQSESDIL